MKWRGRRTSSNVEDRRGRSGGRFGGGFPGGFPFPGGGGGRRGGGRRVAMGGGLGGLIVVVLFVLLGGNPGQFLQVDGGAAPVQTSAAEDELARMVSVVLADTEAVWDSVFAARGRTYRHPTLVLFSGTVQSACGGASAATGPFYCPLDEKLYIDLSFYQQMKTQLNAPGDFAMAYVVAHEVGHHIQKLSGKLEQVQAQRRRLPKAEYNQLSVRLELQADFLAGMWAHHAQKRFQILEEGDIEEALNAANAIGDDRLQQQSQGHVVPDAFTHGTSAQRVRWFRKGFQTGQLEAGDTFQGPI